MMKLLVKFRTRMNVAWHEEVDGEKALAFMNGFPGTLLMTPRRVIVVAELLEKQGWLRKKKVRGFCFEAALHELRDFKTVVIPKKSVFQATLTFNAHGMLGDGTIIQFMRMDPRIWQHIIRHVDGLVVKKPAEDSGIVHVDTLLPRAWLKERHGIDAY